MSHTPNRRKFIVKSATALTAVAAGSILSACGSSGSARPSEFRYGVASGDPLTDRVILWTHARIADSSAAVGLTWQVAANAGFDTLIASGRATATADTGFTVKVDATG